MRLFFALTHYTSIILGKTWRRLHRSRRAIAECNVREALGYTEEEASRFIKAHFIHLARVFTESSFFR